MADALRDEALEMPILLAQDGQRNVLDLDNHLLGARALPMALATIVCNCPLNLGDVLRTLFQ